MDDGRPADHVGGPMTQEAPRLPEAEGGVGVSQMRFNTKCRGLFFEGVKQWAVGRGEEQARPIWDGEV